MIDPQKLLGGLLTTALSTGLKTGKKTRKNTSLGGLLGANNAALGMGLLGLAIGAFEHFTKQGSQGAGQNVNPPSNPHPLPSGLGSTPPPLPVPGQERPMPPPPPPMPTSPIDTHMEDALLLIRAMIAAANADYSIDGAEKETILSRIRDAGMNDDEKDYILNELDHPLGLVELANQVKTPEMAGQVYAVSLIVTQADTDVERNYLRNLAKRLDLDQTTTAKWHQQLGIEIR